MSTRTIIVLPLVIPLALVIVACWATIVGITLALSLASWLVQVLLGRTQ